MKQYRILYLIIIPLLFCNATVWYVGQGGLPHIQDGLDSCAVNDTVLVGPGLYEEDLIWPDVQGICLLSEKGIDSTLIKSWSPIHFSFHVTSSTTINDFSILPGPYSWGYEEAVVWCYQSSPTIEHNKISIRGACILIAGIVCQEAAPMIYGNNIEDCYNDMYWCAGIVCSYDSSFIAYNTITGTVGESGAGVLCVDSDAMLYRNEICNTICYEVGGGIYCKRSSPVISHCDIHQNSYGGVYCCEGSSPIIHFCNISDNDSFGVRNIDPNITVDARYNWWGDSTGPFHPVLNPGGLGDAVSDYVLFEPWLREPVGVEEMEIVQPEVSLLLAIFPNPSKGVTTFDCVLGDRREGDLNVYNALGQVVKQYDVDSRKPEDHSLITWDARDEAGRSVPNGIYFIKLSTRQHTVTRKVILMR
jgi:hypothetical protein